MKNRALVIFQKLILALKRIFAYLTHYRYPTVRKKAKRQDVFYEHGFTNECYYCEGLGFVQDSFEFEEFLFSGNLATASRAHFSPCPVCKGRGHIETQDYSLE